MASRPCFSTDGNTNAPSIVFYLAVATPCRNICTMKPQLYYFAIRGEDGQDACD